jgi:hypothetical protein
LQNLSIKLGSGREQLASVGQFDLEGIVTSERNILLELMEFDLAISTPIQTMNKVMEWQNFLRNHKRRVKRFVIQAQYENENGQPH